MRNSPPIPRIHGPVFRATAIATDILIEELPEAVVQPCVVEETVYAESAIEIGEVPHDLLFPTTSHSEPEVGPTEVPDAGVLAEVVRRPVLDRPFSAGWDVLGQYVAYILDRSSRSLRDYIEARARERMSRAERRVQAATKERKYSSRSERTRQKRQRVMKLPAYVAQVKLELQREVHELVKGAHWLTFGARDPENAFCMTRAKNHRQVFFLVQRDEAGSGGKVIGVYDSPHFTRMVRQHGRRGYRKLPLRRR